MTPFFVNRTVAKRVAIFSLLTFLAEIVYPTASYALTGGPSQPEVESFEPVGTTQMVDLSSGDFNYNIPLLDVGGYPINLAYHAGVGTDQEASVVGLGWNINPGVVNRAMRGLPDDFKGELITNVTKMKPNRTFGLNVGLGSELFGLDLKKISTEFGANASLGVFYNNYKGVGLDYSLGFSSQSSIATKSLTPGLSAGLSLSGNSQNGVDISGDAGLSLSKQLVDKEHITNSGGSFNVGSKFNSRAGLESINYGISGSNSKNENKGTKEKPEKGSAVSFGGTSISGVYNFSAMTYQPSVQGNMQSTNASIAFNHGIEISGWQPNLSLRGYFTSQWLKDSGESVQKPAYGYHYQQDKKGSDVLLDINRERDAPYNKYTTDLPLAINTYDVYSASGQGVGGSYRLFRSDVPVLHSDSSKSASVGATMGAEVAGGGLAKFGANVGVNWGFSKSGEWKEDVLGNFGSLQSNGSFDYEPAYFRSSNQITKPDSRLFNNLKGLDPIAFNPQSTGDGLYNYLEKKDVETLANSSFKPKTAIQNTRETREPRSTLFSALTGYEASMAGLDKRIRDYNIEWEAPTSGQPLQHQKITRDKNNYQFSELTLLSEDGARYVYGIPAKNKVQLDVTFNVAGRTKHESIGQVEYVSGDNTSENDLGNDAYFNKKTIPEYAHSYLLTGVLSPDYVDVSGDGITDDDLGTAVRFNYAKIHDEYKWRVPYKANHANLIDTRRSFDGEDKGSYSYGEKEYWLVHSIETKNNIAIFEYSAERTDGWGVSDENGGRGTNMGLRKLTQIILYSKQDYLKDEHNAVPIKTVHFKYNQSLCPGIDNSSNGQGKLTLEKIWFTYGNSEKGRLSSYSFTYDQNNTYNFKASDAWGTYKTNSTTLPNTVYPFAEQNKTTADQNAAAWALKSIKLPSGGVINIEYEADDYGYVQDEVAMRMFKIAGFGNSDAIGIKDKYIYDSREDHNDVIYFDLKSPISGTTAEKKETLYEHYLKGIKDLQYTVFVDVDGQGKYEYIKGYCEPDFTAGYGVHGNNLGWVAIKKVKLGDKRKSLRDEMVSPIARYCWNYAKLYLQNIIYPASEPSENPKELLSMFADIKYMFNGFNNTMNERGYCKEVDLAKSWLRLYEPDKKKLGGGHRVKSIKLSDNWAAINNNAAGYSEFEYGQTYHYTTTEKLADGSTREISSGVASFEPFAASDENPLTQPRYATIENKWAPNDMIMTDEIIGGSFYPAASVVYSKVTVKPLAHSGVEKTATGHMVHEYFTAKDFPVQVEKTQLYAEEKQPNIGLSIVSWNSASAVTSQGYSIILNDMHGKPKAQYTYAENTSTPLSGVKYVYHTEDNNENKLENEVTTISNDGVISQQTLGVEIDYTIDSRGSKSTNYSVGANLNMDVIPFFMPLPIGSLFSNISFSGTKYNSAVCTKVVKQYGLLKRTIAYKNNASLYTDNLLYSEETGEVLLTATQNEYEDFVYNFTYPAYWAYDGMGPAYKNQGITFSNCSVDANDELVISGLTQNEIKNFLSLGDECLLNSNQMVYIHDGNTKFNLIDRNGHPVAPSGSFSLKVVRSGRSNLLSAKMGGVQTLSNPINGSALSFSNVINASAIEYDDNWKTYVPLNALMTYTETAVGTNWRKVINDFIPTGGLCFSNFNFKPTFGASWNYEINGVPDSSYSFQSLCNDEVKIYDEVSQSWININLNRPEDYGWLTTIQRVIPNLNSGLNWLSGTALGDSIEILAEDSPQCESGTLQTSSASLQIWKDNNETEIRVSLTGHTFASPSGTVVCDEPCELIIRIPDLLDNTAKLKSIDEFSQVGENVVAKITIVDGNGNDIEITGDVVAQCFDVSSPNISCYNVLIEQPINPYRTGLQGQWRAKRSHAYLDKRNQSTNPNLRTGGTFANTFDKFWSPSGGKFIKTAGSKWVWSSEVTEYTPFGNEVETRDALDRYSSALYGYNHQVPIAVASNAQYKQIAYDGFEDYHYLAPNSRVSCDFDHMSFKMVYYPDGTLDPLEKHSGRFSMKVNQGTEVSVERALDAITATSSTGDANLSRIVKESDDIGVFKPTAGEYLLSGWLKEDRSPYDTTYSQAKYQIEITNQNNSITVVDCYASGNLIEGWQRVEKKFTIPANAKKIKVNLVGAVNASSWFDDMRIFPIDGNMKSYAYDYSNLRLMAELDENNFATFYEYDLEGNLVRVKKETIDGIKTLQENRNHSSNVN